MLSFKGLGVAALALSVTGLSACEENKPAPAPAAAKTPAAPPTPSTPAAAPAGPDGKSAPAAPGAATPLTVMGLKFPVPQGWKSVPPSNTMRLAEIQVPDASGDAAKACTIAFSTAGGTVSSNIERWFGQIHDAAGNPVKGETSTRQVAGIKISTVELVGSYAGMGDGAPKQNWMLRGSIAETAEGLLFIKMTGPAEQMKAAAPQYQAMLDGLSK